MASNDKTIIQTGPQIVHTKNKSTVSQESWTTDKRNYVLGETILAKFRRSANQQLHTLLRNTRVSYTASNIGNAPGTVSPNYSTIGFDTLWSIVECFRVRINGTVLKDWDRNQLREITRVKAYERPGNNLQLDQYSYLERSNSYLFPDPGLPFSGFYRFSLIGGNANEDGVNVQKSHSLEELLELFRNLYTKNITEIDLEFQLVNGNAGDISRYLFFNKKSSTSDLQASFQLSNFQIFSLAESYVNPPRNLVAGGFTWSMKVPRWEIRKIQGHGLNNPETTFSYNLTESFPLRTHVTRLWLWMEENAEVMGDQRPGTPPLPTAGDYDPTASTNEPARMIKYMTKWLKRVTLRSDGRRDWLKNVIEDKLNPQNDEMDRYAFLWTMQKYFEVHNRNNHSLMTPSAEFAPFGAWKVWGEQTPSIFIPLDFAYDELQSVEETIRNGIDNKSQFLELLLESTKNPAPPGATVGDDEWSTAQTFSGQAKSLDPVLVVAMEYEEVIQINASGNVLGSSIN
jgi:hypothetical protein